MLAFLIRRLLEAALVMIVVAIVAFTLFRFVGDPVSQMVSQDTTIAERNALRTELGLDDSLPVQCARFIWNAAHFNFGLSYKFHEPVVGLIGQRLPATLELSFVASIFAIGLGIPLGVFTGINRDSALTRLIMGVSLIGVSLPTFLIGILLIYLFSVTLHWLPSYGRGDTVSVFGLWQTGLLTGSGLRALILPAVTLGLFQLTLVMRLVRSEMLEVLRTDYIRFGRARGLTNRAIQKHARPRHHRHRRRDRHADCVFDHHRDRLPMAGDGAPVHPGGAIRRHPDHGGLSPLERRDFCHAQSHRRHSLHADRSAYPRHGEGLT
jgi:peptide/nickel transport system permease protein